MKIWDWNGEDRFSFYSFRRLNLILICVTLSRNLSVIWKLLECQTYSEPLLRAGYTKDIKPTRTRSVLLTVLACKLLKGIAYAYKGTSEQEFISDTRFLHKPGRNTDLPLFKWIEFINMPLCFDVVYFALKWALERVIHSKFLEMLL